MSFRTTLAIEIRLSSYRPLIIRSASKHRPCLLSHFPGTRSLITDTQPVSIQTRYLRNAVGPAKTLGRRNDGGQPLLEETNSEESQLELDRISKVRGFSRWKRAFEPIFHGPEEFESQAERYTLLRAEQRATALRFGSRRSPEEIREQWMSMSNTVKRHLLPDILVGCLQVGAALSLRVLEGLPSFTNNFTIRMDCLMKLRREPKLWREIEADKRNGLLALFHEELKKQRLSKDLPQHELNASHAALILEHCSPRQGSDFFEKYLATYPDRHSELLLIFVDYFTKWEDHEQALRAIREVSPNEVKSSDRQLLQRCTNLLKIDTIDTEEASKNFKILPRLLELGIKPDTIIHNMIIMNAIRCNVHRVGWDLYEYLQAENLETTSVTHLLLMKDAFARQDVSGLNQILSAIHKRKDLYHDPYLVGCTMNIIRIIHTYEKGSNPIDTFSHVLSVHTRAWKPDVYLELRMVNAFHTTIQPHADLAAPPPNALAWTIFQYCLIQRQQGFVDRLWDHLKQALVTTEPQITAAAAHEALYGGFIVFYGRSPRTLGRAVDIVQYMLDSEHCQPTGPTWMRLMGAYLRQGQQQEAEQIRQLMLKRGIKPKSKEFAWLQENWPDTEVAARAMRAIARYDTLPSDTLLDEELYEGVSIPADRTHKTESATWDGMVDPWNQDWSAATPRDAETAAQLQVGIREARARND